MSDWPEWVHDEAMRRYAETKVIGHELTEDVNGCPLGVQQLTMTGYIVDRTVMEEIYEEGIRNGQHD